MIFYFEYIKQVFQLITANLFVCVSVCITNKILICFVDEPKCTLASQNVITLRY